MGLGLVRVECGGWLGLGMGGDGLLLVGPRHPSRF
jgi:hypothetical protein